VIESPRVVTVAPLAPEDAVAVAQCIAIDVTAFPHASAPFGLRSDSARVWVARVDGGSGVVGFAAGAPRGDQFYVQGLAVDDRSRRSGVGRALLRAATAHARDAGMNAILLNTSVGNGPAISLYESEGFVVRRRLSGFYLRSGFSGGPDAYEMVRVLIDHR
jgi:ribosomal protein S18 acetylase RimI-like enzyme